MANPQPTAAQLRHTATAAEKAFNLVIAQFAPLKTEIEADNATPFFAKQLVRYVVELTEAHEAWKTAAHTLLSVHNEPNQWARVEAAVTQLTQTQTIVYDHLKKTDNPAGTFEDNPKIPEPKNALVYKPKSLLHDASMTEYRQWQNRFRAYYTQSNIKEQPPHIHRAFVMTCIDDNLAELIELHLPQGTAAFIYDDTGDQQTIIHILDTYFENRHPRHIRLNKLTSLEPTPNQPASGFFQEFLKLSNDATATALSSEELLVALMTTKCPNKELRTELLRAPRNMANAVQLAIEFDAAQKTQNSHTAATNIMKCTRCNRTNHTSDKCWTLKNPCPICKKPGHIQSKCRNRQTKNQASAKAINDTCTFSNPTPHLLL